MNKKVILVTLLSLLSGNAMSYDGKIYFYGAIINPSCRWDSNDKVIISSCEKSGKEVKETKNISDFNKGTQFKSSDMHTKLESVPHHDNLKVLVVQYN